jgi:hypothetical protein
MTLSVTSPFDGGNIRLVAIEGNRSTSRSRDNAPISINGSTSAVRRRRPGVKLRILNCAGAAIRWLEMLRACMSVDREMEAVGNPYEDGILTSASRPLEQRLVRLFRAFTMEMHHDLVATAAASGVSHRSLGQSLDGQEIDLL